MGIITLKIDDELENRLRRKAARKQGAARGVISSSVEKAIELWLKSGSSPEVKDETYEATKKGEKVAEAGSLELLSSKLRELGIDPRTVVITSIPPPPAVRRMGLRTSKRVIHK